MNLIYSYDTLVKNWKSNESLMILVVMQSLYILDKIFSEVKKLLFFKRFGLFKWYEIFFFNIAVYQHSDVMRHEFRMSEQGCILLPFVRIRSCNLFNCQ